MAAPLYVLIALLKVRPRIRLALSLAGLIWVLLLVKMFLWLSGLPLSHTGGCG